MSRNALPWRDLRYALWLPFYLLAFLLLERIPGRTYWATQLPIDSLVPFCDWFVIPYCLWYPLLIGVGLWLWRTNSGAFRRYMRFLACTFFLSELIWCFLPSMQELRVVPGDSLLSQVVAGLYRIDTPTNVFPSVHVVGSIGAALAAWDGGRDRPLLRRGVRLLALFICLSTVCVKQHSLMDVAGGLALSLAVAVPVYRQVLSPRVLRRRAAEEL